VKLKVKTSSKDPRPYIISNLVAAKAAAPADLGVGADAVATPETQETEQVAREKAERERMARERAEEERLKNERLKAEQLARQKAEEERKAQEKSERERIARERAEAERQAKLKADEERRARERNEKERIARQKAEADRVAREKAAAEKRAREEAEKARLEALKKKKPAPGAPQLFGNMEFPNLVDSFSVKGDTGTRILDKETSEYVTSQYIYAQAFTVKDAMSLDKVSLAMRKFGGDGSVYVDLVRDSDGKPNILDGVRSDLVSLEKITRKPGYYWVDFGFPKDAQSRLKPGKYWIVLRSSGEAIMNWFYIPGKPYGDSDDTRSTAKGFQWEDILNYDFVFRISGKTL